MKISRVLYKAADVMRERGRCPNDFADRHGRVCVWGAINVVVNKTPWDWRGTDRFVDWFAAVVGTWAPEFSNHHCKNTDDAVAALVIAADIARADCI